MQTINISIMNLNPTKKHVYNPKTYQNWIEISKKPFLKPDKKAEWHISTSIICHIDVYTYLLSYLIILYYIILWSYGLWLKPFSHEKDLLLVSTSVQNWRTLSVRLVVWRKIITITIWLIAQWCSLRPPSVPDHHFGKQIPVTLKKPCPWCCGFVACPRFPVQYRKFVRQKRFYHFCAKIHLWLLQTLTAAKRAEVHNVVGLQVGIGKLWKHKTPHPDFWMKPLHHQWPLSFIIRNWKESVVNCNSMFQHLPLRWFFVDHLQLFLKHSSQDLSQCFCWASAFHCQSEVYQAWNSAFCNSICLSCRSRNTMHITWKIYSHTAASRWMFQNPFCSKIGWEPIKDRQTHTLLKLFPESCPFRDQMLKKLHDSCLTLCCCPLDR